METILNDQTLDITFENEKTVGDVIHGVRNWLSETSFHITEIRIDNEDYDIFNEGPWSGLDIDSVKRLQLTAQLRVDIRLQHLKVLNEYFQKLDEAVSNNDREAIALLEEDREYIKESAPLVFQENSGREIVNLFFKTAESTRFFREPDELCSVEEIHRFLQGFLLLLVTRIREIENPENEIALTVEGLEQLLPELCDVSIMLQTGKDKAAMNCILKSVEVTEKITRLLTTLDEKHRISLADLIVDAKPVREFYLELNGMLNELSDAFTAQDSVLIGDLMEYEIEPRLSLLKLTLVRILEELQDTGGAS